MKRKLQFVCPTQIQRANLLSIGCSWFLSASDFLGARLYTFLAWASSFVHHLLDVLVILRTLRLPRMITSWCWVVKHWACAPLLRVSAYVVFLFSALMTLSLIAFAVSAAFACSKHIAKALILSSTIFGMPLWL